MNPENLWVKKSETIPWDEIEERYFSLFSEQDWYACQTATDSAWITADPKTV